MFKHVILVLSVFAMLGCGEDEEVEAPAAADNPPAEQAEEAPAAEAAENQLVGTWKIVVNEELTEMLGVLEAMAQQVPEDRRPELQATIEGLRNAEVTFTADTISMEMGPETKTGSYTIDSQEGNAYTITVTGEGEEPETDTYTLSDDGQTLSLTDDGKTMTFERQD